MRRASSEEPTQRLLGQQHHAKKSPDGAVDVQFGGCDGKIPICLPIMKGWNYTVRLYRPREADPGRQMEISRGAAGELRKKGGA